jgi:hypothetical protein
VQQQTVTLALRIHLFGREPGLGLAPAPACRLDLRFDRFAFPAPCHASLYVERAVRQATQLAGFSAAPMPGRIWQYHPETRGSHTARIHRPPGCGSVSSYAGVSRHIRTKSWSHPRIDTSTISDASCLRLPASYMSSAEPHGTIYLRPRHSVARIKAPVGFAERAPAGAIGNAVEQRSKLPDRRVEICTLLRRVLIQAGFVASLAISLKMGEERSSYSSAAHLPLSDAVVSTIEFRQLPSRHAHWLSWRRILSRDACMETSAGQTTSRATLACISVWANSGMSSGSRQPLCDSSSMISRA